MKLNVGVPVGVMSATSQSTKGRISELFTESNEREDFKLLDWVKKKFVTHQ